MRTTLLSLVDIALVPFVALAAVPMRLLRRIGTGRLLWSHRKGKAIG